MPMSNALDRFAAFVEGLAVKPRPTAAPEPQATATGAATTAGLQAVNTRDHHANAQPTPGQRQSAATPLPPPSLPGAPAETEAERLDLLTERAERAAIQTEPPFPAPGTPDRERLDATQRRTVAGLLNAALMRPTSWAQPDHPPPPGAWCSCCRGRTWWRERDAPRGWRCWLCHPAPRGHPAVITLDT
jgi:hypothetical protein